MEENEKNIKNDSRVLVGKIVLIIILGFNIFAIVCQISNLNLTSISAFIAVLEDSNTFLSMVCISFVFIAICTRPFQTSLFMLGVIDIVMVNKLYSNKRWSKILNYIKNFDYQVIFFIVFITVVILLCSYLLVKNVQEYKKIKNLKQAEWTEEQNAAVKIEEKDNINEKKIKNKINNVKTYTNDKESVFEPDNKEFPSILMRIIIFACICLITWAVIDYISYEVMPLNMVRPRKLEWISDILWYIAIICAAVVLAIFIDKLIISFLYMSRNKTNHMMQFAAVMAIFLEIALIIFTEQFKKLSVLNDFLSAVTDNLFGTFIVLIAIFLIFHIACLIFLNFIFPEWGKNDLAGVLSKRVKKIEKNLVIFACNLFDGIVALFYFIPDFFNTIGSLFLEREKLFPNSNDDLESKEFSKSGSNGKENKNYKEN